MQMLDSREGGMGASGPSMGSSTSAPAAASKPVAPKAAEIDSSFSDVDDDLPF